MTNDSIGCCRLEPRHHYELLARQTQLTKKNTLAPAEFEAIVGHANREWWLEYGVIGKHEIPVRVVDRGGEVRDVRCDRDWGGSEFVQCSQLDSLTLVIFSNSAAKSCDIAKMEI